MTILTNICNSSFTEGLSIFQYLWYLQIVVHCHVKIQQYKERYKGISNKHQQKYRNENWFRWNNLNKSKNNLNKSNSFGVAKNHCKYWFLLLFLIIKNLFSMNSYLGVYGRPALITSKKTYTYITNQHNWHQIIIKRKNSLSPPQPHWEVLQQCQEIQKQDFYQKNVNKYRKEFW